MHTPISVLRRALNERVSSMRMHRAFGESHHLDDDQRVIRSTSRIYHALLREVIVKPVNRADPAYFLTCDRFPSHFPLSLSLSLFFFLSPVCDTLNNARDDAASLQ